MHSVVVHNAASFGWFFGEFIDHLSTSVQNFWRVLLKHYNSIN